MRLIERAAQLRGDEAGSVSMEYGLVGTLVSIAIVSALTSTGTGLGDKWNSFATTIVGLLR